MKYSFLFFMFILLYSCKPSFDYSETNPANTIIYKSIGYTPLSTNTMIRTTLTNTVEVITPSPNPLYVSQKSCINSNGPSQKLINPSWTVKGNKIIIYSLGGGMVKSNEITIELLLYCDARFQYEHHGLAWGTAINGLGIYINYRYEGTYEKGDTNYYYGIGTNIMKRGSMGPYIEPGYVDLGTTYGVISYSSYSSDFVNTVKLYFTYIIMRPSGILSGAKLEFDNLKVDDGIQPSNISLYSLNNEELQSIMKKVPSY